MSDGCEAFVLAAGSANAVRLVLPQPGELRLQLASWSTRVAIAAAGAADVEVIAPATTGGHQLAMQFSAAGAPVVEHRFPVHVVASTPVSGSVRLAGGGATADAIRRTGAVVDPAPAAWDRRRPAPALVIGEGALGPATGALLGTALAAGASVLVLAQQPPAARHLPLPAGLETTPSELPAPVRFTTGHHAVASLPRARVLSFEDAAMRPDAVFDRLGSGPWASEVAVGMLSADGTIRGTVVGAHDVGPGRLIVCQFRLAEPAAAGHAGAIALLADLLRWAAAPRRPFEREHLTLADGRSMTLYPFPECRRE